MPTNYDNQPTSIDEPSPTITANRKHHYVINPSHGGHVTSTDAPCPVIVARQDKAPLSIFTVEQLDALYASMTVYLEGDDVPFVVPVIDSAGFIVGIAVRKDDKDTPAMLKIKEFMVLYWVKNIKMRMLKILELLSIQGFPKGFILEGSQADQKKFIGNSVVPQVVTRWCLVMADKLNNYQLKVA